MNMKKLLALLLAVVMVFGIVACTPADPTNPGTNPTDPQGPTDPQNPTDPQGPTDPTDPTEPPYQWVDDGKTYSYRTYNTVSPSNWCELTYQDNNDATLLSYTTSSFFTYDFKFDEYGEIVPGEFVIKYMAATGLEDVTAEYAEEWGLDPESKGYAFKITLRDDLKWQNGDPIVAGDFVYTMQEQLNPLFQNYRADSYYAGSVNIVGAQSYVKQGLTLENVDNGSEGLYVLSDLVKGEDGVYTQPDGEPIYFALTEGISWCGGDSVAAYAGAGYLDATAFAALQALADAETGRVLITDESIELWKTLINTSAWGNEDESYLPNYWVFPSYTYPEFSWENVGLLALDDYTLVVIMTDPLDLIDEEGNLTYHCAYDFSGLPLVHKATYEACKQAPVEGSTLWTTTYNSSLETTMSWGPFMLESFQAGKEWVAVRNTNWFGYHMPENEGLYMTDRVVEEIVDEWNTAWLKFLAGQIDGIGIDVSIAPDYKGSSRAYFTPSDFVGSAQLQSSKAGLEAREAENVNKTMLTYTDFRMAMSLGIDRAEYSNKCTTSSLAGFGLFNSMHYYDVANGGVYRNTDEAKQVLCDVYGVDVSKFDSLDDAVESITGYNPQMAKELVEKAYQQALADGEIDADDVVILTFGSSTDDEATRRHYDYLSGAWTKMCEGTSLEGRIKFEFDASFGTKWATDFRAGAYDICLGGWTGAAWNPGYFLLAYLDDNYRYATGWDTSSHMMTFTMKGVGENGADITDTMSLMDWYSCLNGLSGCKYNWSESALKQEQRLQLIAALEGEILKTYYAVPLRNSFSASMLSYKLDYITYEYNTFMGYGGLKYAQYHYTDEEWALAVFEEGGELDYKR